MLSPTSIKENNRLAFELARSLGVACPLTPNMMVTTTVPDKLAVTSFVYQLHQYFTKATRSAVTRSERRTGSEPQSPTGVCVCGGGGGGGHSTLSHTKYHHHFVGTMTRSSLCLRYQEISTM